MNDRQWKNIAGWAVFALSLLVYLLTMAPTSSFWDCAEFIACAHELEVTHPPGAPLFLLIGRVFSMFSFGDPLAVAWWVNLVSVLASAFAAMFICWTTIYLAEKVYRPRQESTPSPQRLAILGSGVIAGLTSAWVDSVWFNAVEAEVYALSSFFTAAVIWLMFKWESKADEPGHLRYLLLIAYLMGLSIGVHLLNLLTIPALGLLFYFRKFSFSWSGFLAALSISLGALILVLYGVIESTFSLAWQFEKWFTGTMSLEGETLSGLGWAMGSGALLFAVLLFGVLGIMIWLSQKNKWLVMNTALLGLMLIMIGFSSYALIFIRSGSNPPVDMNNPENLITFLSYMRREQYGDRPLLKGAMYHAQPQRDERGYPVTEVEGAKYFQLSGYERYVFDLDEVAYQYEPEGVFWFPRMYDPGRYQSGPHAYVNYVTDKGEDPDNPYDDNPSQLDNINFFFSYQVSHMYLRYFLWNFVGRESDLQDSRWESGLELVQGLRYLPERANNKGKNHYFYLPLLLGLLGLAWQMLRRPRSAVVLGFLFLLTGLAIVVYLNQWPLQPRERDYSYAGSFQTFAIWVGLGVMFLFDLLGQNSSRWKAGLSVLIGSLIPLLLLTQNWDDHSRKGRWVDVEFAYNLLNSCEPNAILFTGGDNDTFSLWYAQEVEGHRTDVRVVNLELLLSDWYIDQLKEDRNQSAALPISMEGYAGESQMIIQPFESMEVLLPSHADDLLSQGIIDTSLSQNVDSLMRWPISGRGNGRYLLRKDSVLINVLRNVAAGGWKRPIYFANTLNPSSFLGLGDFLRLEGLAYRLLPIPISELTSRDLSFGWIDQDRLYDFVMNDLKLRGLDDPAVYHDQHIREVIGGNYRNLFFRLGQSYAAQIGTWQVAQDSLPAESPEASFIQERVFQTQLKLDSLMQRSFALLPHEVIPFPDFSALLHIQMLLQAGLGGPALDLLDQVLPDALLSLDIYQTQGFVINQENSDLRLVLIGVQSYLLVGQEAKARGLAQQLQDLTGSELGFYLIQQMQNAP